MIRKALERASRYSANIMGWIRYASSLPDENNGFITSFATDLLSYRLDGEAPETRVVVVPSG